MPDAYQALRVLDRSPAGRGLVENGPGVEGFSLRQLRSGQSPAAAACAACLLVSLR